MYNFFCLCFCNNMQFCSIGRNKKITLTINKPTFHKSIISKWIKLSLAIHYFLLNILLHIEICHTIVKCIANAVSCCSSSLLLSIPAVLHWAFVCQPWGTECQSWIQIHISPGMTAGQTNPFHIWNNQNEQTISINNSY